MKAFLYELFFFSSSQHLTWFLMTFSLFLVTLLPWGDANRSPGNTYFGFGVYFTIVTLAAVVSVSTRGNTATFSHHCIWYNGLMAAQYFFRARAIRRRLPKRRISDYG